jgi:hypothetical protein
VHFSISLHDSCLKISNDVIGECVHLKASKVDKSG